jgi:pyridoxal 5'-phosphate synthase pdxS subunit
MAEHGTLRVKTGLAEMLKGGVIMDVVDADQAKIAEEAGACAVMALERVPADIRVQGGVARMSDPAMVRGIQEAVSVPVMAKCRIGHFVEAQILQALEIDYIDESEVLTPADLAHHVDKWRFTVPFVCGATNLGEALRRIGEGAAMIRTKGEAGTGDIVNAVTHMRSVFGGIRRLQGLPGEELYAEAKELRAPYELVRWVAENGRLPVVTFTAGGIWVPTACSSGRASSSRAETAPPIPTGGPRTSRAARARSSRRRRTSPTPGSWRTCRRGSDSRWSALRRDRSPRASVSKCAAGSSSGRPPRT